MDCVMYSRRVEPLVPEQRLEGAGLWGKHAQSAKAVMTSSSDDDDEDDCATVDHPCIQPNQVFPGLYLAGAYTEGMLEVLEKYGITHVLQVGVPGLEVFPHHLGLITYGNIHLIDSADEDLVPHLPGAITWLDGCLHSGIKVLVHCVHGQSRSPAVVIAYLMWRHNWDFPTALDAVRATRPRAAPNPGFEYQLRLLHAAAFDTASWPGWDGAALAACQLQASEAAAATPAGAPWQLHHPYQEAAVAQQQQQQHKVAPAAEQPARPVEQQQQQEEEEVHPAQPPTHPQEQERQPQVGTLAQGRHEGPCAASSAVVLHGATDGAAAHPAAADRATAGCGRLPSCCIM